MNDENINSNKSFDSHVFVFGSDVGFDFDEIEKTKTEDLIIIRKSILRYVKSNNQKRRNGNFIKAYSRINEEIKARQSTPATVQYKEAMKILGVSEELRSEYLTKKRWAEWKNKEDRPKIILNIPRFFHDSNQSKTKENVDEETKKFYKTFNFKPNPNSNNDLEFGEEDFETFKCKTVNPVTQALRDFEIKSHIFDYNIREEPLFNLNSDNED